MRDTRTNEIKCPQCGTTNDAATDPGGDEVPREGNASICIYCGKVAIFIFVNTKLGLREPTDEEMADLESDPSFHVIHSAVLSRIKNAP